jgi:hypothetical protein
VVAGKHACARPSRSAAWPSVAVAFDTQTSNTSAAQPRKPAPGTNSKSWTAQSPDQCWPLRANLLGRQDRAVEPSSRGDRGTSHQAATASKPRYAAYAPSNSSRPAASAASWRIVAASKPFQ